MKPSKRKPPSKTQTLLGVDNVIGDDWIETQPSANKTRRTATKVQLYLDEGLSCSDAGSLAGSVGWMGCWYWGRVARAVLRPLYARSTNHGGAPQGKSVKQLTDELRAALLYILQILRWAPVRRFSLTQKFQTKVAYADAYFTMDKRFMKPNQTDSLDWQTDSSVSLENGWGACGRQWRPDPIFIWGRTSGCTGPFPETQTVHILA